jgi:hypothetical protein
MAGGRTGRAPNDSTIGAGATPESLTAMTGAGASVGGVARRAIDDAQQSPGQLQL